MNDKRVTLLHNLVRYPIIAISIPIQCIALGLKYFADGLNMISQWWGNFLIKKYLKG